MSPLSDTLRNRGYRLTLQREMILDVVESISGHISVEAVFAPIHRRFPQVNVSTIYRTLELLEHEGLLTHTHFHDAGAKWHRSEEGAHQHLACERCGAEQHLDLAFFETVARELDERYGFRPHFGHFAIMGLCKACQDNGEMGAPSTPALAPDQA